MLYRCIDCRYFIIGAALKMQLNAQNCRIVRTHACNIAQFFSGETFPPTLVYVVDSCCCCFMFKLYCHIYVLTSAKLSFSPASLMRANIYVPPAQLSLHTVFSASECVYVAAHADVWYLHKCASAFSSNPHANSKQKYS